MSQFLRNKHYTVKASEDKELYDALAEVQHEIWAHWMHYMFTQGEEKEDGSWVMPADKVQRWTKQMHSPYTSLSESEKDSDREQVEKIWPLLLHWMNAKTMSIVRFGQMFRP